MPYTPPMGHVRPSKVPTLRHTKEKIHQGNAYVENPLCFKYCLYTYIIRIQQRLNFPRTKHSIELSRAFSCKEHKIAYKERCGLFIFPSFTKILRQGFQFPSPPSIQYQNAQPNISQVKLTIMTGHKGNCLRLEGEPN